MSPITYENREGDRKICRRELALNLSRRCSVPGKEHICFCIQEEGECCANQDVYTGDWLGFGITLMNSFGQLK